MSTLNVEAISHPTSGSLVTINGTAPSNRNLIINGAMQVAQRGTSLTGLTGDLFTYHTIDRYKLENYNDASANTSVWTMEQVSDAPGGFSNSLKLTATTADNDYGTGLSQTNVNQIIEAQDLQHLQYNTADAKSLTLSFWVKSSVTGTYIVWFHTPNDARQTSKTYTINSANTWEYKTLTISGDTGGAIPNTNGIGMYIRWVLGTGSQYTSGTYMDGAWQAFTQANVYAGHAVNVASATNNSWQITGVQLEVGSVATPFEHRSYGDELRRCQRYYQQYTQLSYRAYVNNVDRMFAPLIVSLRATPITTAGFTGNIHQQNCFANTNTLHYDISISPNGGTGVMDLHSGYVKLDAEL